MIDLTDPFGIYRRKELEYDNKILVQRNKELEAMAVEHAEVDKFLVMKLSEASADANTSAKELKMLQKMFHAAEDARKSLGEKNRALNAEVDRLTAKLNDLRRLLVELQGKYDTQKAELDELYKTHEELLAKVYGSADGTAG